VNVRVGTAFEVWQQTHFRCECGDPFIAGPNANPARDGISNQLKYALGLDPLVDASGHLPKVEINGGLLTITYNKVLAATTSFTKWNGLRT
jgi:hypothetical protein